MTTFGLEDVRESFNGDVTRFLTEVEKNAKTVVSTATVALPAERTWQAPLEAMVVGLHGIAGSSALIGLDSMSGTARILEELAVSASESVRMIKQHAARLKRIASLCIDGSSELRMILEHELNGRSDEARKRSGAFNTRLDSSVKKLDTEDPSTQAAVAPTLKIPAIPKPDAAAAGSGADEGWDEPAAAAAPVQTSTNGHTKPPPFGAATVAPATTEAADSGEDELVVVFREEARETLSNLQGYVGRLEADAGDSEAGVQCARLLHLLKGAAASVGQTAIAERAGELHRRTEKMAKRGFTAATVTQLRTAVEELVNMTFGKPATAEAAPPVVALTPSVTAATQSPDQAAAPVVATASQASFASDEDEETRNIFLEEARRAIDDLRSLVRQIQNSANAARGVAATRAERVLHRLKGSAMIVGETQTASLAARGQTICEALENVDVAALTALVDQIAAMVRAPASSSAAQSAPTSEPTRHRYTLPSSEEWDVYLEEATTLLDDLDRLLVKIERSARPNAELSTMFRMYHTLKGASNAVGLAPLGKQLHIIEAFIERIVGGAALPDLRSVVKVLADEHAAMRANVSRASSHGVIEVDLPRTSHRLASLGKPQSSGTSWIADSDPVWASSAAESRRGSSAHESSRSHASRGADAESAPSMHDPAPGTEGAGERRFIRVAADRLDGLLDLVGELVVARSRILARIDRMRNLQDVDQDRQGVVIRLVDDFATSTQFANLDGRRQKSSRAAVAPVIAAPAGAPGSGFGSLELDHYEEIHVLSRQLDEATSDITEMRREIAAEMQRLTEDSESLSSVIADLQSEITQARMLTLDTLFARLQLPVRDAAQRTGREVEIVVRGEQVAIDKSISDALFGPLLHMVRNAVAHGIEAPDRRRELGKPVAGTLTLAARQDHGQVVLEISDDGAGIDTAKLKAVGVEKGLVDASTPETDSKVLELVFVHGISTSASTGDVAGRGVGGNVVRRAIDRLNGSIEIISTPGKGTTFRISLPLSMSITQAVLIRSGAVTMALPITFAERILTREGIGAVDTFGRNRVKVGENMIPVHDTRTLFPSDTPSAESALVICMVGGERIAIEADEVVGQEEIVVKSLGNLLEGHPLFSGSTQRGDGELVLIVDVPGVLASETEDEARSNVRATTAAATSSATSSASESATTSSAALSAELAQPEAPAKIAVTEVAPLPTDKLRVLFVDDSLSVRKVAERMLLGLGVEIVTAVDGQDALEKLRTMSFSLVFTDLEMPRMHGYELIREMQYLPAYKAIPVVVISSRSGQKHIDQALDLGAREYLTKPFSPEILGSVLERLAVRGTPKHQ